MKRNELVQRTARRLIRRRWLRRGAYAVLTLLILSILLDRAGAFGHRGSDWTRFNRNRAVVTRIIDGETFHIRLQNETTETVLRLIGVDAPELHPGATLPPDHWAERAKAYLDARITGHRIVLGLEPTQTRDHDGRLLAYAYLSDSDCLNLDLIRDGQAYADRRHRHTFRAQFEAAENEARKKSRGLWKDLTEDQMPAWRREWFRRR